MEGLNPIIQRVAQLLRLDSKAGEYAVLQVFEAVLPLKYRGQAKGHRIYYKGKQAMLEMHVTNPVIAQEIGFEREALLKAVNAYSPQTGIFITALVIRSR